MRVGRRRLLTVAAAGAVTAVAGCLSDGLLGPGDGGTPGEERTPREGGELARVEEPPYEISEPDCGAGGRDPLWLCANMPAEPSLTFAQVAISSSIFTDEGLRQEQEPDPEVKQFYAAMLTEADDLDRVDQGAGGGVQELIEGTEFEDEVLLVAETGWGSGTVTPHLKRIEETASGLHAFGCYRRPCGGTDDYTMRTVVARVERPDKLERVTVSLTVSAEHLVNFEAGEGVVTVADVP